MRRTILLIYASAAALFVILLSDDSGLQLIAAGLLLLWAPLVHWIIASDSARAAITDLYLQAIEDVLASDVPAPEAPSSAQASDDSRVPDLRR